MFFDEGESENRFLRHLSPARGTLHSCPRGSKNGCCASDATAAALRTIIIVDANIIQSKSPTAGARGSQYALSFR